MVPRLQGASGGVGGFVISHYAGNVEYSGEGMMKKNQDTLQQDLVRVLEWLVCLTV
jgi:myosin heavy subunit